MPVRGLFMQSLRKILVVEDNALNRRILCRILEDTYEVLEAENGREALDVLRLHGEAVSLILLDVIMPVMDGYEFLRHVKADPVLSRIPVIVMTQKEDKSEEAVALSSGAADFVAKPYNPQILLKRTANIINLRETAALMNSIKTDRLTGLYSKEYFYQQINRVLTLNPDSSYDIICSNIENFKLVNDVFGNAAGDRLLQELARAYQEKLGDGLCGRLNSDHFACLYPHHDEYDSTLFESISEQVGAQLVTGRLALKWGIYHITDPMLSAEQLCDRALLAAQSIKGQYGKHFAYYDSEIRERLLRNQAISDSMTSALADGQFKVYLQPKYRLEDERLAGAEALVRWMHPEMGFLSPAQFIPIFEQNGFITALDLYVWEETCRILCDWDAKGYPPIPVSVNVSRADIYNADLPDLLRQIVEKHGIDPSRLHLEITESAYTENPRQIIDTVSYLRGMGFVIEMDDFGSGYSSLNMLNELPIDILKLDMKFIQSETAKPESQGILQFIIGLARWMNLSVIAEGVETKAQVDRLRQIGCDYVQGFFFARPVAPDQFEDLFYRTRIAVPQPVHTGEAAPARKPMMLVADEDAAYRDFVRGVFADRYDLIEADSAQHVLEYLAQHKSSVDAMILSDTLPRHGEPDLLRLIKGDTALWDMPVIVVGASDMNLEWSALERYADDYIGKPHRPETLRERMRRAVKAAAYHERERILKDAAYRDFLTGLLNRRGLEVSLKQLNNEEESITLYLFDMDNLKACNDNAGHSAGDLMLKRFGMILKDLTRSDDILARLGGDEFVAVMKSMPSEQVALSKGEKICKAVRESNNPSEPWPLSCSAGVAMMRPGESFEELIQRADRALYEAKTVKGICRLGL